MKTCLIIPKCRRAKNRVNEHGDTMELLRSSNTVQCLKGKEGWLVRSLKTNGKDKWMGWFSNDEIEIQIKEMK